MNQAALILSTCDAYSYMWPKSKTSSLPCVSQAITGEAIVRDVGLYQNISILLKIKHRILRMPSQQPWHRQANSRVKIDSDLALHFIGFADGQGRGAAEQGRGFGTEHDRRTQALVRIPHTRDAIHNFSSSSGWQLEWPKIREIEPLHVPIKAVELCLQGWSLLVLGLIFLLQGRNWTCRNF